MSRQDKAVWGLHWAGARLLLASWVGLVVVLLCLVLAPLSVLAQGESSGVVSGQVVMGDANQQLPEGLQVELLFLPNAQGPPRIQNQPVGADGQFRFEGVDPSPNHRYLVRVKQGEEEFYSTGGPNASTEGPQVLAFNAGQTELVTTPITIGAPATTGGNGVVSGQVVMGDADQQLPEGLQVELLFLPNAQGPPRIQNQPVGADGQFRFEGVDPSPNHRYLVRVKQGGEEFYSTGGPNASTEGPQVLAFNAGQTELVTTPITLLSTTTDASTVHASRIHYVLAEEGGEWGVAAIYSFVNPTNQIIRAEAGLQVPLPREALRVRFEDEDIRATAKLGPDGATIYPVLRPGERPITVLYALPYNPPEQTVKLPVGFAAEQVLALVLDRGQKLEVPGFVSQGTRSAQGQSFTLWSAEGVAADATIDLAMTELPPPSPAAPVPQAPESSSGGVQLPRSEGEGLPVASTERPNPGLDVLPWWAPLLLVGVAVVGVVGYLWRRPAPTGAEERAALRQRRDALVVAIAALDDRYAQGTIGPTAHQRQREAAKEELTTILRRLGLPSDAQAA